MGSPDTSRMNAILMLLVVLFGFFLALARCKYYQFKEHLTAKT